MSDDTLLNRLIARRAAEFLNPETAKAEAEATAKAEAEAEKQQRQRDVMDIKALYDMGVSDGHLWQATADVSDPQQRQELFTFLKDSKAAWLAQ